MNYKNLVTDETGGFPFDLESIQLMQESYNSMLQGVASAFGTNVILSGVADLGATYSDGYVVVAGEVLPFIGGTKATNIIIEETINVLTYNDTVAKNAEITRVAKTANTGGTPFTEFKRLDSVHLQQPNEASILRTKVIEIGDWNMNSDDRKDVNHGLSKFRKIRTISLMIRNDVDNRFDNDIMAASSGLRNVGVGAIFTGVIVLFRTDGGLFDNSDYSLTPYNRGWVTIQYVD